MKSEKIYGAAMMVLQSEAIEKEERAGLVLEEKIHVKDEAEEKLNNEIKELEVASENLDVAITQKTNLKLNQRKPLTQMKMLLKKVQNRLQKEITSLMEFMEMVMF